MKIKRKCDSYAPKTKRADNHARQKKNLYLKLFKDVGIYDFIAIKNRYSRTTGGNFYAYIKRRFTTKDIHTASVIAEMPYFLKKELHYHTKEYVQYQ